MKWDTGYVLLGTLLSIIIVGGALHYLGHDLWYTAAFLAAYVGILGLFAMSKREIVSTRLASGTVLVVAIVFSGASIVRDTGSTILPTIVILVALWLLLDSMRDGEWQ